MKIKTKANSQHAAGPEQFSQRAKRKTKPKDRSYAIENTRTPSQLAANFITFHHFHHGWQPQ